MPERPTIFISHVHEEAGLALLFQKALQEDFSDHVDVFTSSDDDSIPTGNKVLDRIDDALVNCVAGLFLISPRSIRRPWVNFELGALWIRSVEQENRGDDPIPIIPICHSGLTPSTLPKPLSDLQGVTMNSAKQLQRAFRSIRRALNSERAEQTNFEKLAAEATAIERMLSYGASLVRLLGALDLSDIEALFKTAEQNPDDDHVEFFVGLSLEIYATVESLASKELNGYLTISPANSGFSVVGHQGVQSCRKANIALNTSLLLEYRQHIRELINQGVLPRRNSLEERIINRQNFDITDFVMREDTFTSSELFKQTLIQRHKSAK